MKVPGHIQSIARSFHVALLVLCLPLILMLSGCGTTVVAAGGGTGANAPTVVLSASPGSVAAGASSVLTVSATNATRVVITGSDSSSYTLAVTGGTQTVTPTATTTYTATATGAAGTTPATALITVTVTAAAAATVNIVASPTAITAGGSSVLTITAANATSVVVTGSDGVALPSVPPTGGTITVTPTATTTYTASAVGAAGSAAVTATAVVTVTTATSAPTVNISANPTSITAGGSSTLTVAATNATSVAVSGSDGTTYPALPGAGGTVTVTPTATTTYTATATGAGGTAKSTATVTVTAVPAPTVSISASPTSIVSGSSSVLTVTATNATAVTLTGNDNTTYTVSNTGGTATVTPTATTIYTATATGANGSNPATATATATVTVTPAGSLKDVKHVVLLLQENHSFDNYFGMLNPYKIANNFSVGDDGKTYLVDGIDDKLNKFANQDDQGDPAFSLFKLKSSCIDDLTSAWVESYGDVSRYDFTPSRPILMDGFVHTAEGFTNYCENTTGKCSGTFSDNKGQRAMGYYDQNFLNYYYYMASQFALSDRWFSPVSSKSISNRLATYTGGTTQGLVSDPGNDDGLPQLGIKTFFSELNANNVSWKIYYTATNGGCLEGQDCSTMNKSPYPATDFSSFSDANNYLYFAVPNSNGSPTCPTPGTQLSSVVGDSSNSFCIDITHIAPISYYQKDVANNTLPQFAFIEAGYGRNDEHPGSTNSVLDGQYEASQLVNSLMSSPSWSSTVFFLAYDEGGGPFDHVPPVPGSSNLNTDATVGDTAVGSIPDISSIAVDADGPTHPYKPCLAPGTTSTTAGTPTIHCDLKSTTAPGANPQDAAAISGFPAQLGFRIPNMIISPFTKKHYVGHDPMDHTAILKFVEEVFIPNLSTRLTPRVAAQPDLNDFFDFTNKPWLTPPTPPAPFTDGGASCTPTSFQ